jgi:2'-5' RNA ligase
MRLFVAVEIPEKSKQMISELQKSLPDGLLPVRPESMHITLKFIGEQPEGNLRQVISALDKIAHPQFAISLLGVGAFPKPARPNVLWVGCNSDSLATLAQSVDASLFAAGVQKDPRQFSPHLTIARATGHTDLSEFVRENKEFSAGRFRAESFHLFGSTLLPAGALHTKLASFPLKINADI